MENFEANGEPDDEVAAEVLHRHRKRNDSQVARPLTALPTAPYSLLQPLATTTHYP